MTILTENDTHNLDDIHIGEPVAITHHCFDNIYGDMVRRSGLDPCEDTLSFIEAMMRGFDAVQASKHLDPEVAAPTMCQSLALSALRSERSMIDGANELGKGLADFVRCLTFGKPTVMETWPELRWLEIEGYLYDGPISIRALADEARISFTQARNLIDWYDMRTHWL